MMNPPKIAPHDPCLVCARGDTSTGVTVEGAAEVHAAFMMYRLGIGESGARAMLRLYTRDHGLESVPSGDFGVTYRLCKRCAQEREVPLGEMGDVVPVLRSEED
jgi:hypothetical protein